MTYTIDEPRSPDATGLLADVSLITAGSSRDKARRLAHVVLRRAEVQHVSLAAIDRRTHQARVLATVGTDAVRTGLLVFVHQSTRLKAATSGRIWASSDFAREPDFDMVLDQLAKVIGYRSGCTVPIIFRGWTVGAVLMSSIGNRLSWDAVTRDVSAATPMLAAALRLDQSPYVRPRVLVMHPDMLVGQGLARVLERGLDAEVRIAHGPYAPRLPSSLGWADVVVTDREYDLFGQNAGTAASMSVVVGCHWPRDQIIAAVAQAIAELATDRSPAPALPMLSRRELDLLRELDTGLPYKGIAARLGLATETVRTYSKSLYSKLDAHSRGEVIFQARQQGLL
ncbi:response regulator transcription factor [Streptomyces sp. NPDC005122]